MSILSPPAPKSPEGDFELQKYLLLHSQHDALQRNLHSISTCTRRSSTSSSSTHSRSPNRSLSAPTSLSSSPTTQTGFLSLAAASSTSPSDSALLHTQEQLAPEPLFTPADVSSEYAKLQNVNLQIKTTLTELLNCECVRRDAAYRMWVQSRLMDAERELRGGRRESVSGGRRQSIGGGRRMSLVSGWRGCAGVGS